MSQMPEGITLFFALAGMYIPVVNIIVGGIAFGPPGFFIGLIVTVALAD